MAARISLLGWCDGTAALSRKSPPSDESLKGDSVNRLNLALEPGCRVRIDANAARMSLPKDAWCGQLSMEGVRLSRTLEAILDASGFRPYVTEVRTDGVEVATSFFGDGMSTLRIPRTAVIEVTQAPAASARGGLGWAT